MRILALLVLIFLSTTASAAPAHNETAIFAGGCFWSIEGAFNDIPGVVTAVSGYTGGSVPNPTYDQVSAGDTGHVEAVKITYDPSQVTYEQLLKTYWHNVDPFNDQGQFCDYGPEYRTEIFTTSQKQAEAASASMYTVEKQLGKKPVTKILPAEEFYAAEDYHQHYEKKNPEAYAHYRTGCGRDKTTQRIWGSL